LLQRQPVLFSSIAILFSLLAYLHCFFLPNFLKIQINTKEIFIKHAHPSFFFNKPNKKTNIFFIQLAELYLKMQKIIGFAASIPPASSQHTSRLSFAPSHE
jgi:hypothetical protein